MAGGGLFLQPFSDIVPHFKRGKGLGSKLLNIKTSYQKKRFFFKIIRSASVPKHESHKKTIKS